MALIHPAQQLDGIFTGSGLLKYLEDCRQHALSGYDGYQEASSLLRAALRRANGSAWLETQRLSRGITAPLRHAGNLHVESCKYLLVCANHVRAYQAGGGSAGRHSGQIFEIGK